jgi:sterol desaturase/sphingolipid hydroxylase (fatty acid hydroxylase superfamily)
VIEDLFQRLRSLVHLLPDIGPSRALGREALLILAGVALVGFLEWRQRRDLGRYRSRSFGNDVIYSFFYQGGVYNLLIYVPLFGAIQQHLGFAKFGVLHALPTPAAFVLYWLIADFCGYWIHRLFHTWPALWAFHSVHHAPQQITFLTSNRNHVVEQLFCNAAMLLPIVMLGAPQSVWLPMLLFMTIGETLQHAVLDWRYGPLYRVLVSPMFHNLHHSTKPEEYNGNYGKILSVWDFLFGTAVDRHRLPERYGLTDSPIDERLSTQLLHPFRTLFSRSVPRPTEASQGLPESR